MIIAAVELIDGQAHTRWTADHIELDLSTSPTWTVALRTWLRERARHMSGQNAEAIVRNVGLDAREEPGKITILSVDPMGSATAREADTDQWDTIVNPQPDAHDHDPHPTDTKNDNLEVNTAAEPPSTAVVTADWGQPPVPMHAEQTTPQPAPAASENKPTTTLFGTDWSGPAGVAPTSLPRSFVAVVNLKGGVGKTTLAVTITEAMARMAGHNDLVLAEFNPAGTIRQRTLITAPGTVDDFIAHAADNPDFGRSQRDLDNIVSWQDSWAVLPSTVSARKNDSTQWRPGLAAHHVDLALDALTKTFRMIVIDTANDPRDTAWQKVITRADRILVPATWDPDVMTLTAQMMEDMAADISPADLKRRIIWVMPPVRKLPWPDKQASRSHAALVDASWKVLTFPHDKHLAEGGIIQWDRLAASTRKAANTIATALLTSNGIAQS